MSDYILIILSFALAVIGIVGAIVPVIPAALVSYAAVVVYFFTEGDAIGVGALVVWGVVTLIASAIDAFIPPLITKSMGGSRSATRGSFIGTVVGAFVFPPFGMIVGAFAGALLGEMITSGKLEQKEFLIALGSFLGFILGTGIKLIVSVMILILLIWVTFF